MILDPRCGFNEMAILPHATVTHQRHCHTLVLDLLHLETQNFPKSLHIFSFTTSHISLGTKKDMFCARANFNGDFSKIFSP